MAEGLVAVAERLQVNAQSLDQARARFAALEERLSQAVAEVGAALSGTGGMAGGDRPGQSFSGFYDPAAHHLLANLATYEQGLASIAGGLAAMEHNYTGADVASRPTGNGR